MTTFPPSSFCRCHLPQDIFRLSIYTRTLYMSSLSVCASMSISSSPSSSAFHCLPFLFFLSHHPCLPGLSFSVSLILSLQCLVTSLAGSLPHPAFHLCLSVLDLSLYFIHNAASACYTQTHPTISVWKCCDVLSLGGRRERERERTNASAWCSCQPAKVPSVCMCCLRKKNPK